jgi:hypothetical protein
MLPIINDAIDGEKLSIYNQRVQPKHPLNGVRLKNASELHLMQGPLTVFDGGVYAGDAKIPDLPPKSERLVSYALDLDVEVAPTTENRPERLVSARIVKGVLELNHKYARTQKYVIKNSGRAAKTVLVEYPLDNDWKLLAPEEPAEKTRDMYRFAVKAEPGKPAELVIEEERTQHQAIAITNLNDDAIAFYLGRREISDTVKQALREVVRRKAELAAVQHRRQLASQQIARINQDQDRTRQNMQAMERNTDLYNRYMKKLTDQEDELERLNEEVRNLDEEIVRRQNELSDYVSKLELS